MPGKNDAKRLQVWGEGGLDMPLRVLNLIYQLDLLVDRIAIERGPEDQLIDTLLHVSDERGSLLVEKLRSSVLVWNVKLSKCEVQFSGSPTQLEGADLCHSRCV